MLCSWFHAGQKVALCGAVLISSSCCNGSLSEAMALGPPLLMGAAGLLPASEHTMALAILLMHWQKARSRTADSRKASSEQGV